MGDKGIVLLLLIAMLLTGCGTKQDDYAKLKEALEQAEKTGEMQGQTQGQTQMQAADPNRLTDEFVMDKETRVGFMLKGQPVSDVPKGYTAINTVEDLKLLSEDKGKYILMNDLDMTGMGWKSVDFNASLNGNYHVISGLEHPLFDLFTGTVENLGLENVDLAGAALVEVMCGSQVSNCYVTGKVSGNGGLIDRVDLAYFNKGGASISIGNCYNAAEVVRKGDSDNFKGIGGIVGSIDLSDAQENFAVSIYSCENYGKIEGDITSGGIVGTFIKNNYYYQWAGDCTIRNCFNYGEILGDEIAGGIIGSYDLSYEGEKTTYILEDCANYGSVTLPASEAGFYDSCGGICGSVMTGWIDHNYILEVWIRDCLNAAMVKNTKGNGGEICGERAMNGGTLTIERCLGIGDGREALGATTTANLGTPEYNCKDYHSTADMSIAEMKDIQKNLPSFSYPYPWGIDQYFCGFPHPYADDESLQVQQYAGEQKSQEAEKLVQSMDVEALIVNQQYVEALDGISMGGYWPEDEKQENYCEYLTAWSNNPQTYFAIRDMDQDGQNELVVRSMDFYYAIYKYDLTAQKLNKIYTGEGTEQWEKDYGSVDSIEWMAASYSNYDVYQEAYMKHYASVLKQDFARDLGVLYLDTDQNLDSVLEALQNDYGFEVSEQENDYSCISKGGEQIMEVFWEDGGGLGYLQKTDGVTLFGITPGMSEDEAVRIIEKYGFYKGKHYSEYTTYYKMGSCMLYFRIENGTISQISLTSGTEYTG